MEGFAINLALPDLWQQEAVRHLNAGRDVVVDAPTGAGKTFIFELLVKKEFTGQAVYTVPTRALANDKRMEWQRKGWNVGIATGDLAENLGAPVIVATLETQRERLLRGQGPDLLVIDEYQMIGDRVRGLNYELAVASAPGSTQLLMLSGSVENPEDVVDWLKRLERDAALVQTFERPVPLDEMPVAALPYQAPKHLKGFWPRTAAEALAADYGPLLIFSPKRNGAEKIARQIAAALPQADPLHLTDQQRHICGKELTSLVEKRIAFHHSGLSYLQRAGVIEPLAKAGQLRVIVATMGLAAGINFSVRSVMVSDTRYHDGEIEKELDRDELLQMFGRAGRRGLDEIGYVLTSENSPHLLDAAPKRLRRSNEIDWPTLIRVMQRAVEIDDSPVAAARDLCRSLFSKQKVRLGFTGSDAANSEDREESHAVFGLTPHRIEILNSEAQWEERHDASSGSSEVEHVLVHSKSGYQPALSVFGFVADVTSAGRVCRLDSKEEDALPKYGKEVSVAQLREPTGDFTLTRNTRTMLNARKNQPFSREQIDQEVIPRVIQELPGTQLTEVRLSKNTLSIHLDVSKITVPAYRDSLGVMLATPRERVISLDTAPTVVDPSGHERLAASDTAAYAWRKLGLIEPDASPTPRGIIFSFFQGGEGLAVAAALEDPHYAIEDLVLHLANLRGSYRFELAEPAGSEHLAQVCRQTYGTVDYDGYLRLGIPPGYGEGTAETVGALLADPHARHHLKGENIGKGDIERALVEWLSLLRHIRHAPDYDLPRWRELKETATKELARRGSLTPSRDLPEVPELQLKHQVRHRLHLKNLTRQ